MSKHKPIDKSQKLEILNLEFVLGVVAFPNLLLFPIVFLTGSRPLMYSNTGNTGEKIITSTCSNALCTIFIAICVFLKLDWSLVAMEARVEEFH